MHNKTYTTKPGFFKSTVLALVMAVMMLTQGLGLSSFALAQEEPVKGSDPIILEYPVGGAVLHIDQSNGNLTGITFSPKDDLTSEQSIFFDGAYVDFAYDGSEDKNSLWGCYVRNTLFYQDLD